MTKLSNAIIKIGTSLIFTLILCASLSTDYGEVRQEIIDPITYDEPLVMDFDEGTPFESKSLNVAATTTPTLVRIHYRNDDGENSRRRLYTWASGVNGKESPVYEIDPTDDSKMWFDIDLTSPDYRAYQGKSGLYFIIKFEGTWDGQSTDTFLDYAEFPPINGTTEIWTINGEGSAVEMYASEEETYYDKILTAKFLEDWKTIECYATYYPETYELYAFEKRYLQEGTPVQASNKQFRLVKRGTLGESACTYDAATESYKFSIKIATTAHINVLYVLETNYSTYPDKVPQKYVSFEKLYDSELFESAYTYSGDDLGVTLHESGATFKLWAPACAYVTLNLYRYGTPEQVSETIGNDNGRTFPMSFVENGIWQVTITSSQISNIKGWYYTYEVYSANGLSEVVDPYAKGCGVNGLRGYIYDPADTDPEGWDEVPEVWDGVPGYDIARPSDLTVYEVHIRDLTMDETWVSNVGNEPGTYAAFSESGTTYTDEETGKTVTTGFDHIEELGVKAVQILPFFDSDNDETEYNYNWGYNPTNYNCLEGAYASSSSDPDNLGGMYDAAKRITEFKELVMAYANNENHTRIIMDVVYNHVSSASNSNFNKIMPKYYFRMTEDGYYYNGSGCNNEVKTERTMVSKFIVDSVSFWAEEYKIKGFRFDLMGLIDVETMKKVRDALYEIDPDIVVYGEGWSAAGYNGDEGTVGATSDQVYSALYGEGRKNGVGGFNDEGRDAVRGGNNDGGYPGYGFISQGQEHVGDKGYLVQNMLKGVRNIGANPDQTVNYVSCHDNYTAFDQLNYTLKDGGTNPPDASYEPNPLVVAKASLSIHAAVFASQGIAFIHGGEEILRTKIEYDDEDTTDNAEMYGYRVTHNSYNSSDETNSFKWDRKISIEYHGAMVDVSDYTAKFKNAIALHETFPRFAYGQTTGKVNAWQNESGTVVGYQAEYYFAFFAGRAGGEISFDNAPYADFIFTSAVDGNGYTSNGTKLTLEPYTLVVMKGNW